MERGGDDGVVLERLLKAFQSKIDSLGTPNSGSGGPSTSDANSSSEQDFGEIYTETEGDPHEPTMKPKFSIRIQGKRLSRENLFKK